MVEIGIYNKGLHDEQFNNMFRSGGGGTEEMKGKRVCGWGYQGIDPHKWGQVTVLMCHPLESQARWDMQVNQFQKLTMLAQTSRVIKSPYWNWYRLARIIASRWESTKTNYNLFILFILMKSYLKIAQGIWSFSFCKPGWRQVTVPIQSSDISGGHHPLFQLFTGVDDQWFACQWFARFCNGCTW